MEETITMIKLDKVWIKIKVQYVFEKGIQKGAHIGLEFPYSPEKCFVQTREKSIS